jgi:glucose-1-phosphate adenylyltransferase
MQSLRRDRVPKGSPPLLTMLLAGGAGERMLPLTREHAKPMVPFGGIYRLIDIPLSNCINSGLRKICILTQHKALSLNRHVRHTWNILSNELDEFIEVLPPMKRLRDTWYLGTADAVYQNMQTIEDSGLPFVLILSADHVYKMNYLQMLKWHKDHDADVTVATTQIPPAEASRFGIVCASAEAEITGFEEKPKHNQPGRSHRNPDACSASMGIYLFSAMRYKRTPWMRSPLTTLERTFCLDSSRVAGFRPMILWMRTGRPSAIGVTSAHWNHTGRRTWIWWL